MTVTDSTVAEESNYWETTVHPAKSMAEVEEMLEEFGFEDILTAKGKINGYSARMIRFTWKQQTFRFEFQAKQCRNPDKITSFGGKRRSHREQAEYQMGREMAAFIKAMLIAAKSKPVALFGFLELPGATESKNGLPVTAGQLNVSQLTGTFKALPESIPELEIIDIE